MIRGAVAWGILAGIGVIGGLARAEKPEWVFVGTYTDGGQSKGIYRFSIEPDTGKTTEPVVAAATSNPSFLAIHPERTALFAANELYGVENGKPGGGRVTAFALDAVSGNLSEINAQPSAGSGPCFLAIDKTATNVLVTNYGSGSAAVLPLAADGRLGAPSSVVQHAGRGADTKRQEGPHAHSVNLDAANHFAIVADLGLDRLFIYRFDAKAHTLTASQPPFVAMPDRSGPRHFAFHPNGKHAYVINELASSVTAFDYDAQAGTLFPTQTPSTLPPLPHSMNTCADLHIHPSGKFLYGSNRGVDSLAIFAIDEKTGKLTPVGQEPTRGKTPRNFAIHPSGRWLLAANQDSNSIVVFQIDQATGRPTATGTEISVPKPVCVQFVAP